MDSGHGGNSLVPSEAQAKDRAQRIEKAKQDLISENPTLDPVKEAAWLEKRAVARAAHEEALEKLWQLPGH